MLARRLRFTDADLLADPREVVLGIVAAQPFSLFVPEERPCAGSQDSHAHKTIGIEPFGGVPQEVREAAEGEAGLLAAFFGDELSLEWV